MSEGDLYKILESSSDATYEQLKKNYQRLIKEYHPDKHKTHECERFKTLDKAWKTLRDIDLRKQYDASLLQSELNDRPLIYADVCLEELNFADNTAEYPCRCGSNFTVHKDMLEEVDEVIVECCECTNCVVIKR